jgi:hypothetical protein
MSNKRTPSRVYFVKDIALTTVAFLLLMSATTLAAVDSKLGIVGSVSEFLGFSPFTFSIYGNVTYVNSNSPPMPISNVRVCGNGTNCTTTDSNGDYVLTGVGSGVIDVCASKTPASGGGYHGDPISAYDAALISAHVSGTPLLPTTALRMAADVTGNGTISSTDASYVSNYVVSTTPVGSTGTWSLFLPGSVPWPPGDYTVCHEHNSVSGDIDGDDFVGILYGDVSGDWITSDGRPAIQNKDITIALPQSLAPKDTEVVVPVKVQGVANKDIVAYEFDLRYDSSVLQAKLNPVALAGTVSRDLSYAVNAKEPGLIRLAVYGPTPIKDDGVLLNLKFTAIGASGSVSPLTWDRILFNKSSPGLIENGQIIVSPAAKPK